MDNNKLCERVFALNEDIRYAGVIDSQAHWLQAACARALTQ